MTSYAEDWKASDMTLRDYFAAQALGGLVVPFLYPESYDPGSPGVELLRREWLKDIVNGAYSIADAMLDERRKNDPNPYDGVIR